MYPVTSAKPSILVRPRRRGVHISEVKRGADGILEHFYNNAVELGLSLNTQMEEIMKHCNITIIASLEPDQPWSISRLDALEDRVMTLEKHEGMNRKEERRRIGS